jgi:hypothetical protein
MKRTVLKSVAATAALLAAVNGVSARADVIYSDPPDIALPEGALTILDITDDGFVDMQFFVLYGSVGLTYGYTVGRAEGAADYVSALSPGTAIGPGSTFVYPWCNESGCSYPWLSNPPQGDWAAPGTIGTIGMVLWGQLPEQVMFGWMRVQSPLSPGEPAFVLDWAYEDTPMMPIAAGDVGAPPCPPTIARQPSSQSLLDGDTLALQVRSRAVNPIYRWMRNGQPLSDDGRITGSSTPTLAILGTLPDDSGEYRVHITSDCGEVTSDAATVDVARDCAPLPGAVLSLRGNGYAAAPDSAGLDLGSTATIEGWFRGDPNFSSGRLVSKGDGIDAYTDRALDITFIPSEQKVVVEFFLGPAYAERNRLAIVSPSMTPPAAWHHFATTIDTSAGIAKLYIDGGLAAETTVLEDGITPIPPLDLRNSSMPLRIGSTDPYCFYKGRIDEVRVWNVVRTAPEIAATYNTKIDPASPGLVAYYAFDEGSGTVATDLTGHGNDAMFVGDASRVAAHPCCPGDYNNDGFLDFFDFNEFVDDFEAGRIAADFNADGFLDFFDFNDFVLAFETGC